MELYGRCLCGLLKNYRSISLWPHVKKKELLQSSTIQYIGVTLLYTGPLVTATLKLVDFCSPRKLTSPRGTGAAAARAARAFESQPPAFSNGKTPLKWAIDGNKSDVVAYLRSIGAPE